MLVRFQGQTSEPTQSGRSDTLFTSRIGRHGRSFRIRRNRTRLISRVSSRTYRTETNRKHAKKQPYLIMNTTTEGKFTDHSIEMITLGDNARNEEIESENWPKNFRKLEKRSTFTKRTYIHIRQGRIRLRRKYSN